MTMDAPRFLDGNLLVAMPSIGDSRFDRSVIYLCAHSAEGAMGIVVNKPAEGITFPELLERLNIVPEGQRISLPPSIARMHVQFGGPVETGRGFVLHTTDYFAADSTLPIDEKIGLTATLDVLRAIARGRGPRRALMALGYAGWGPGQLETEIEANAWLSVSPDEALLFGEANDAKWRQAFAKLRVDPLLLSAAAGHA
jgi:putative transcriptional regulator